MEATAGARYARQRIDHLLESIAQIEQEFTEAKGVLWESIKALEDIQKRTSEYMSFLGGENFREYALNICERTKNRQSEVKKLEVKLNRKREGLRAIQTQERKKLNIPLSKVANENVENGFVLNKENSVTFINEHDFIDMAVISVDENTVKCELEVTSIDDDKTKSKSEIRMNAHESFDDVGDQRDDQIIVQNVSVDETMSRKDFAGKEKPDREELNWDKENFSNVNMKNDDKIIENRVICENGSMNNDELSDKNENLKKLWPNENLSIDIENFPINRIDNFKIEIKKKSNKAIGRSRVQFTYNSRMQMIRGKLTKSVDSVKSVTEKQLSEVSEKSKLLVCSKNVKIKILSKEMTSRVKKKKMSNDDVRRRRKLRKWKNNEENDDACFKNFAHQEFEKVKQEILAKSQEFNWKKRRRIARTKWWCQLYQREKFAFFKKSSLKTK